MNLSTQPVCPEQEGARVCDWWEEIDLEDSAGIIHTQDLKVLC
jgi:hypothetical protein